MTQLERQVRTTQHRLWLNRWFNDLCRWVAAAALAYAVCVFVQRLFDAPIPLFWVGIAAGCVAITGALIQTYIRRETAEFAAARLDAAAGLRERISSGRYIVDTADPFAAAVVTDAERASASITVRRHIRLTMPKPIGMTAGALALASLMFLLSPGLISRSEAKASANNRDAVEQTKVIVKKKLERVRRLAENNPAFEDLEADLSRLDKEPAGKFHRPSDVRHEAVKKIDKLADAIKQKRESGKYDSVNAMRKMLRGLKVPKDSDAPTRKLARALAQGDFKTAKEEINAIKEQLATLKMEGDKELVVKLSKQLDDIAKQLAEAAKDKKLTQQLAQAGIKKEDIERMLQNLKKKDLDDLKKQLEEKGMSQKQISKLVKQLQKKQSAGSKCKQMSKALAQGAKCNSGQMGEAIDGLSQAAAMLTELEQLEQEMNQIDSTLADLQNAKNDLGNSCSKCNGTGMKNGKTCGSCSGDGMGKKIGKGRGGLASEQQTQVGVKVVRQKVHTGKGAIIGQFLVDGEQIKGEVGSRLKEVVRTAERDASDLINRDRIPRQYQKAVKDYFSDVRKSLSKGDAKKDGATKSSGSTDETEATDGEDKSTGTSSDGE